MPDDDRDFITRAQSASDKLDGTPLDLEAMVDNFALYGRKARAAALDGFDAELRGEIGSGADSLRRHLRLRALRQRIGGLDAALRKARR
jgi:hypothetical protein